MNATSTGDWLLDGGRARLDIRNRQLHVAGEPARLGGRAFDRLLALLEQRDRVVAKQELMDRVWSGLVVEENNLQVLVATLRRLLGAPAIQEFWAAGAARSLEAAAEAVRQLTCGEKVD